MRETSLTTTGPASERPARVSVFNERTVKRALSVLLVAYFGLSQLAILPAALQPNETAPDAVEDPYSLTHLVQWLQQQDAEASWSSASAAPAVVVGPEGAVALADAEAAVAIAVGEWQALDADADLSGVSVAVADLPDLALAETAGSAITIDVDAAGHGWGDGGMDLLTVARHEVGHLLGHGHGDGLMSAAFAPGETHTVPAAESTSVDTTSDGTADGTTSDDSAATTTATDGTSTDGATTDDTQTTTDGTSTEGGTTGDGSTASTDDSTSPDGGATGWTVDGGTATWTGDTPLAHELVTDGSTLSLVDAAGVADTLDLTGITAVAIVGSAGDDVLTVTGPMPVDVTVDLGDGADELIGPSTDQVWEITEVGGGTVTGISFRSVENVTGAAGNQDTFVIGAAGSISGIVAGGDGGFDVVEFSGGDFDQVDFVATGPQSGTVTRDGDVLTYTGMEPISSDLNTPVQTVTLTGADDEVEIQDATAGDGEFEIVVVNGTAESVTILNAGAITELVIDLGAGADVLRFIAIDSLFTGRITVIGGSGDDTFHVPDVVARWDVTGINAGTYQGVDGTGEDLGPAVAFSTTENLVGAPTEADAIDFDSGAGLTGTFVDGTGELTVALAGFVKVTGDYDFVHDGAYTAQVVPDGGGVATGTSASVLQFGGTSGTGFIGTDPLDTPIGLQGTLSSFGLAIVTTATQGYHVFSGTLDASFVGGDILSIPLTTMTITINDAGSDGTFLDLSGSGTITAGSVDLDFTSTVVSASVTTTLSIEDFVHVSGTFTFSRGGEYRVEVATGLPADLGELASDLVDAINEVPRLGVDEGIDLVNDVYVANDFSRIFNVPVAVMTFSVTNGAIFVGYNPSWVDANANNQIDPDELDDDAIGLYANGINFAFAKLSPRPTEYRALNQKLPGFTAMKLEIGSMAFVGIDEITLSATQLLLEVNNGKTWPGGIGPPVVDFAASFPGDPTDADADGEPDVPVGLEVGGVYLDYDGNQRFGISSPQVVLTLGDFVHVAGGFSFIKGPTAKVDIGTGLAAVVAEGLDALDSVAPDLKAAIEALATSATEPEVEGGAVIKDDFSIIWNVEVSTLQFGMSDINIFVGYAPGGWTDVDGDKRIDLAEPGSGLNGAWVLADDDRDGDGQQDVDELGDAIGIYASDIDLGFVSMTPTLASLPGFDDLLPTFFALKATADNLSLVGIPEITLSALDSVLKINSGTPWGQGKAWELPYTPRIDWAASFPDDPDGTGPATSGYVIETGNTPVIIDFGGFLLTEVSSKTVILTISDFVHISGGFSFREGPGEVVEVATGLPAGLSQGALEALGTDNPLFQPIVDALTESGLVASTPGSGITVKDDFSTIWNVPVGTLQVGLSDVNVFLGYNPGWVDVDGDHRIDMAEPDLDGDGWDAANDDRDGDGTQDVDELSVDAVGLYAFDIDVGLVMMSPSVTGFDIDDHLPNFYALYASADNISLVGVPGITVSATDIVVEINNGDAWPGGLGPPVVNFEATFGGRAEAEDVDDDGDGLTGEPGGYQIDTGNSPIYIAYNGNQRIGASSPEIIVTLGDFVHLTGGFSFEMGPTEKVDIATGLPSDVLTVADTLGFGGLVTALEGLTAVGTVTEDPADGTMALSEDFAYLYNLEVATLQFGISDVNVFIGFGLDWTDVDGDHRIDRAEPDRDDDGWGSEDDRDGDGVQDVDEFGDSAVGLYAFDVDLGFALMTPTLKALPGFDEFLPEFYALKASADELSLLGIDAITLAAMGIRIEVNDGGNWGGTPWGGVIDWESSFDGDTDGDGTADGPVGFRVDTGRDPVYLDYPDQAILGGGADLVVIGISEFVHLRGSIYFEKGTVLSVPLVDGLLETSVLNGLVSELGLALDTEALEALNPVSGNKELEFLNIGGQELYAFVGVGGPHWTTASGDLTHDLLFECKPGETCADECDPDTDATDGHAAADDHDDLCVLTLNENAIGLAVSDLDFALALGTPTNQLDPMRYITLRASVDEAGLVGLEDLAGGNGITATVRGVEFELNMSTPTLNGIPLLPVLDWNAYALDPDGGDCTTDDLAALESGGAVGEDCEPFGVKTGRLDDQGDPVKVYFLYDSLLIRAAVEMLELDIMGVLVVRGSVAFVLGPVTDVTLTDELATVVSGVTTMTIGGANIFGFIGVGGPHWLENGDGDIIYSLDTDGDGWGDGGGECVPPEDPGTTTDCKVELNPTAIGLALTGLDFGLFVGTKISPTAPAAFIAADINLDSLSLVGVPGVTATALLAIALNLGFTISGAGASFGGINFKESFRHDSDGDGTDDTDGFALDTGDPDSPMILDFETSFVEVQLAGSIEIRAGPQPTDAAIASLVGIFYLGIDLEAGSEEFRLLALAELTIGPDIGSADPILSIGALGVLILNADGFAADFQVNVDLNVPGLALDVDARLILNTTGADQTLVLPERLSDFITRLGAGTFVPDTPDGATPPPSSLGPLATVLLARLVPCAHDALLSCYTISGAAPDLIIESGGGAAPNEDTIDGLFGRNGKDGDDVDYLPANPYVVVLVDGKLNLVGIAEANVFGAINIGGSAFQLIADVEFVLGARESVGIVIGAKVVAEISEYGLLLNASVSLEANLLGILDLDVAGSLAIDTREKRLENGIEVANTPSFALVMSGDVTVLKVLSFNSTLVFLVGGPLGAGEWAISGTVNVDLYVLKLGGSFFVSSWGSFAFQLTGGVNLTIAGTGIEGSLTAHLSYCLHSTTNNASCQDDVRNWVSGGKLTNIPTGAFGGEASVEDWIASLEGTEATGLADGGRTLWFSISGSVKVKVLGFTLAGFSLAIEPSNPIPLGGGSALVARGTIELFWFDIDFKIPIGYISLPSQLKNEGPPPPVLGTMDTDGSTLLLNVGSRASHRGESPGVCEEIYTVWYDGGTSETVVEAFGREDRFSGVTAITGDFGDCDDALTIDSSVTVPVTVTGGGGDDTLVSYGSGNVSFTGGTGFDVLRGGLGNDRLDGGADTDSIIGGWGDDVIIGGGSADLLFGGDPAGEQAQGALTDNDTFFGTLADLDGDEISAGTGFDRWEILATGGAEQFTVDTGTSSTSAVGGDASYVPLSGVTVVSTTAVRGGGLAGSIESILIRLQGGDTVTIDGPAIRADGVTDVAVTSVGGADSVVLQGQAAAEVVTISGGQATAPATVGGASAAVPTGTVTLTTVVSELTAGNLTLKVYNTGVGGSDADTLTVETLGGADRVAVKGLEVDATIVNSGGIDHVYVSNTASCTTTSCTLGSGTLDGMDAGLTVTGAGSDVLKVDDRGDGGADIDVVLTSSLLRGADLHADGIAYTGLASLELLLGAGADTVHVQSTAPTTQIRTGGGVDTVYISSTADVGITTPTGDLNSIDGLLQLFGEAGADVLTMSDFGDSSGNQGTLDADSLTGNFSPADIEFLGFVEIQLDLGDGGDDTLGIPTTTTGATVTVNGNGGNDWIAVDAVDGGSLTINGGAGDDNVDVGSDATTDAGAKGHGGDLSGITGDLTFDGGLPHASDWLWLDDTTDASGDTGIVTNTTITGFSTGDITYLGVEHVELALGTGDDDVRIRSTNGPGDTPVSETVLTVLLGDGDDTVDIASDAPTNGGNLNAILGHVILVGGLGHDDVHVSDRSDTGDNTGWLTSTDLWGLGMGTDEGTSGITYSELELLDIDLGSGDDTFIVRSTHAAPTTLDTHAGDDTVDVGDFDGDRDLTGIDGFLDIDTGTNGVDGDKLLVNGQSQTDELVGRVTADEVQGLATEIDDQTEAADLVQTVTITGGGGGTFTLSIGGTPTIELALNATGTEVRDALVSVLQAVHDLAITAADVLVSRTPLARTVGIVWRITYTGLLAGDAGRALDAITVDAGVVTKLGTDDVEAWVVGSSTGRIQYTSVEDLEVNLGSGIDHLELTATSAVTVLNAGDGNDVVDVETIAHDTLVQGQDGADTLQVNLFPEDPEVNRIDATLTLDGSDGGDVFHVQLAGTETSFIDVIDNGTSGVDSLYLLGTAANDQFLLRTRLVALLNTPNVDGGYDLAEYVTYSAGLENLVINTLDGDDAVAFDDNTKTVATTVNLGDGKDFIQVGQLYGEECIAAHAEYQTWFGMDPNLAPDLPTLTCFDDRFIPPRLTDSTQGMLSNGISESTTVNGGAGNDLMIVFRNRAVLTLNGESGDDTFVIRTFLEEDSETQLDAGEGTDVISYIMNAPVNVNGGDGYDRLYVVGTEADDVFVITADGIYGAGRYIAFVNVELVGLDTVEGNDYVHVLSTAPGVAVEVYGGLGSDTIEVGSNLVASAINPDGSLVYDVVYAAADDLVGHSGLVVHNVESASGDWTGLTVDGIAAEVADDDEAAVVILESGGTTVVREFDGVSYVVDTYQVLLTREPDALVRVDALAGIRTPEQEDAFAFTIELSLDGTTWIDPNGQSQTGVFLYFHAGNWDQPVTVWVRAAMDTAQERVQVTSIRHTVNGYIEGTVGSVTTIGEHAGREFTDTGAFAGLDLVGGELVITGGADAALLPQGNYIVVWHDDDTIRVDSPFGPVLVAGMTYEIRGVGEYAGVVLNDLFVTVIDDDVSEVVVLESGVDTTVVEGGAADTYTVEMSAAPAADTQVRITTPEGTCISADGGATVVCDGTLTLTFTPTNFGPQTVTVTADDDDTVEGFQFSRVVHEVWDASAGAWVGVGEVLVGTADNDTPSVLVTETDGSTVVAEGIDLIDTYTIDLTAPVAVDDVVTVHLDAIITRTQYDATPFASGGRETYNELQVELRWCRLAADGECDTDGWSDWGTTHDILFTEFNWSSTVLVEVRAIDDEVIDGRILQAFAEAPARVNRIQGALYVDGGVSEFGYPLDGFVPVMLPGETSSENFITPNPAFDVIEEHAVDTLIVHNEDDVADSDLTLTTVTAETSELSEELAEHIGQAVTPSAEVSRYALLGLGMGPRGIEYLDFEVLDVLLGSGSDDVVVETTHVGTTTLRGHGGDDEFFVEDIKGHTRILGGDGGDVVTVGHDGLLEAIDAQLLISGEGGDDTTIVDDTADETNDTGTLTQTALIGLDMDSTTANNLFSLELSDDATSFTITINASRDADLTNDWPGVTLVDFQVFVNQASIDLLAGLGPLPYGDYSSYLGTLVADIDAYLLAGLIQQALFARVQNAPAAADAVDTGINGSTGLREFWLDGHLLYTQNPVTGAELWYLPDGTLVGDDRFATTGCGREGTTGERDSRCSNSVYVWDSGGRVFLIGFQGELVGLDIDLEVNSNGTYATDLLRTDGITYDTLETLDIQLGAGDDLFNVRGTLPQTLLDTGDGDDVVFVSDAAGLYAHTRPGMTGPEGLESALDGTETVDAADDLEELHERTLHGTVVYDDRTYVGTLDEIDGDLDIDTGAGSNTLAVSDHQSSVADTGFTIGTDPNVAGGHLIVGLANGEIGYTSTGGDLAGQGHWPRQADAGMFGRGITIHLGTGNDSGIISSVRGGTIASSPFGATVTTVFGNVGDDVVLVTTPDVAGALLVVHGDEGDDTVDGSAATLALDLFGDEGYDILSGGTNDDRIFGDDGRSYFLLPIGSTPGAHGWDVVLGGTRTDADLVHPYDPTLDALVDGDFDTVDVLLTRDTTIGATGGSDSPLTGDVLTGNDGSDTIIGGAAADTVDAGDGDNLVLGDFGQIVRTSGELDWIVSTDHALGGADTITTGVGDDTVVGGAFGDTIDVDAGHNVVVGDSGELQYTAGTGVLEWVDTALAPSIGGDDTIDSLGGEDLVIGGVGGDTIDAGHGDNIVIGDNGRVSWVNETEDPTTATLDLITSHTPNQGGSDDIVTGADDDIIIGGTAGDLIHSGAGEDLVFGDHAIVAAHDGETIDADDLPLSMPLAEHPFYWFSIDITVADDGGNDIVHAGAGEDIVLGQHGDDELFGGDDDDDLIGGHNVTTGHDGRDVIDGGAGHDVIAGDNAQVLRTGAAVTTRVRTLTSSGLLVDGVDGEPAENPTDVEVRSITLLDHDFEVQADHGPDDAAAYWGNDTIAGGPDDDVVFGQLGNDTIHGDGTTDTLGIVEPAPDASTDGDDYVEGNGGHDVIFGGLGQDDLIGGSSDLFGLSTPGHRPDGIDRIHGGNGDHETRNDPGLTGDDAHSRDADVLLGDNGRVFRIVGAVAGGSYLTFVRDNYGATGTERIVPRVVELLDYSPIGESYWLAHPDPAAPTWIEVETTNIGGGDFLHGESSDDIIYGATGQDTIFGEAGDDDLFGGANRDWISGGTGIDGIIADHGWINTSRHGQIEPLYGVMQATSQNNTTEPELSTPGDLQTAHINQAGTLHKSVELDLQAFDVTGDVHADFSTFWVGDHDIVYGGWGDDFIHGGEGDDMLSGAEALELYYDAVEDPAAAPYLTSDPFSVLRSIYDYFDSEAGVLQHGIGSRVGEFRCYDEYAPLAQVYVCDEYAQPVDGAPLYLTNNDVTEDDGTQVDDGADVIFGDGGNDWIVGGVNHDRAFGGWGDDLLDMDDDKATNGGRNDAPDIQTAAPTYADIAYGGAGRDVLIANTGADRLIDWVGEYNSYVVPFSPYGAFAISRSNAPALRQYLLDLAAAEGADTTRGGDASRNGEPYGELGMVTQQDDEWQDQTGAPADPQAGNLQGPRDVLRSENFTNTQQALSAFAVDSGTWSVTNDRYESTAVAGRDALSLFYVDAQLPNYFELTATVSSDKAKGGYKSNAYLVFDYQGSTNFRFAGIEIGTGKVQIGIRTGAGWQVLAQANLALVANRSYDLVVVVNGQTVTLYVDGVKQLTYTFASPLLDPDRPELGVVDPLTDGMVGVGSYSAIMRVERMSVRKLTPEITFTHTEQFDGPTDHRVEGGSWTTSGGSTVGTPTTSPAVTTTSLGIAPGFRLLADAKLATAGSAGIVFDWYAADRFKFVLLDVAGDRIVLGHYVDGVWTHDATVAVALDAGTVYDLRVVLGGGSASVLLNGVSVLSHSWFSLLSDGRVGLLARDGTATFDAFTLSTDDPDLTPAVPFVSVGDATVVEGNNGTTTVTVDVTLSYAPTGPVTVAWQTSDGTATAGSDYDAQSGTVTFAAGQTTATITLVVRTDLLQEANETFAIVLSSPTGALLGDASGRVTILNDDTTTTVAVTATDTVATEGSATDTATFVVTRDGDLSDTLAVTVALQGQAVRGVDYTITATGGTLSGTTLTFAAGSDTVTLTVRALTDTSAEGIESVVLSIVAQAHYATGGSGSATVSLQDDAVLPTLSVSDAQVLEGDRGGTWATVTVTLSRAATSDVTVEFRTYDATAKAGEDYRSYVTTLTIAAGQTSVTVDLRILSDRKREGNEWFTVELGNPTNAVVADSTGVVTILDDEGGMLTAATSGSGGAALDERTLAAALADARTWWAGNGGALGDVMITLVDLPGRTLAIATASGILLDIDAAGHGWGASGMDLGTVLRHELGHLLGHDHGAGVMGAVLAVGEVHDHLTRAALAPATSTATGAPSAGPGPARLSAPSSAIPAAPATAAEVRGATTSLAPTTAAVATTTGDEGRTAVAALLGQAGAAVAAMPAAVPTSAIALLVGLLAVLLVAVRRPRERVLAVGGGATLA